MITIKKISNPQLPELIRVSYDGDIDFLEKYHIHPFTLGQAVIASLQIINGKSKEQKLSYYKVMYNHKPVGFFVTYEKCLYSYAINIKYRTKDILKLWWLSVKSVLGNSFISELYDNNTRAINHLQKQGMKIIFRNPITRVVTLQNN